jgi:hypothetical protein
MKSGKVRRMASTPLAAKLFICSATDWGEPMSSDAVNAFFLAFSVA